MAVDSVVSVAVFVFLLRLGLIGNLCVRASSAAQCSQCSQCSLRARVRGVRGARVRGEVSMFVCGLMAIAIVDTFILFAFSIY